MASQYLQCLKHCVQFPEASEILKAIHMCNVAFHSHSILQEQAHKQLWAQADLHIAVSLGVPDTADMGDEGDKSTSSSWRHLVKEVPPKDKDQISQEVGAAKRKREDAATEDKRCNTRVAAQDATRDTEDTRVAAQDAKPRSSCAQQPEESKTSSI